ncbi:MAG: S-methyl-5-thioribose-1-phosphate isomerase [Acidobacteriota bacterium]
MWPAFEWLGDSIKIIDQRYLPEKEEYIILKTHEEVAKAIENMAIRGAPAIGVVASYGIALGMLNLSLNDKLDDKFYEICKRLESTRPTARNLFWAIERLKKKFEESRKVPLDELKKILIKEACKIEKEDVELNRKISAYGSSLIEDGDRILTHCNAGALATSGIGTALGIIKKAFQDGKEISVFIDETRPFLQGARLSTWELLKEKIPVTLITDNMAGWLMNKGEIDLVIVGADRIASNGDIANKIGTYSLSILAKENKIPFYVAAPHSTIDLSIRNGKQIPIEERSPDEVLSILKGVESFTELKIRNPAFDVTPNKYITAIITDKGIIRAPYKNNLRKISPLFP